MADPTRVSAPISGTDQSLSFETGKLAIQSQGAVVAQLGRTTVLVTANSSAPREGIDFFPLTVDVEERMYAAGKIPGSFFRREGRPSDAAVLTCRLIDRPLRPSFAKGYRGETQVVVTVIGADQENPHDVLAINAASAALMISGIPFEGPIGAVRIGFSQDGEWLPHVTYQEGDQCTFELVVAGREINGEIAIMMVEAGGTEKAWDYYLAGAPKVTEEAIAAGLEESKTWIRESIQLQRELVKAAGVHKPFVWEPVVDYGDDVVAAVDKVGVERITAAAGIANRNEREAALSAAGREIAAELAAADPDLAGREKEIKAAVRSLTKKLVRKRIIADGVRIDGRGLADIRPVSAEVGIIPTAHGSGLFQRGETQVLNVLTLGMPRMDQMLDTLGIEDKKRYMHHYNMPPSANGETGRVGSAKRREIGHGLLAERALLPVVPSIDEFPYALRLVSEVLSSNGSTSMGSVCASTLSLMDAGVPLKAPVAGIAMGLINEGEVFVTLTDILGAEDAFGDMDFKVAGTSEFVTALQLDTKIDGLPADVLAAALGQAREARLSILGVMANAISEPRAEVNETAPKIVSFEIPMDKIGEVIGPKGKVINLIQQETGADVNVDDDGVVGTVTIGSKDGVAVTEARQRIEQILDPPRAEVGDVYPGRVVNITKFGAFINILPGRDGLLHISKMGGGKRIERVEDVLELGGAVDVRVDDIDPNGKVSLSLNTPLDIPESVGTSSGGAGGGGSAAPRRERAPRPERAAAPAGGERQGLFATAEERSGGGAAGPKTVAFESEFEAEVAGEFGNLGPAEEPADAGAGRGDGPRRNRSRGGGGGGGGRGGRGGGRS